MNRIRKLQIEHKQANLLVDRIGAAIRQLQKTNPRTPWQESVLTRLEAIRHEARERAGVIGNLTRQAAFEATHPEATHD